MFQMFEWICHNRDVFLMNYVEIGHSYQLAKELQEEHNHFTMSSMVCNIYLFKFQWLLKIYKFNFHVLFTERICEHQ